MAWKFLLLGLVLAASGEAWTSHSQSLASTTDSESEERCSIQIKPPLHTNVVLTRYGKIEFCSQQSDHYVS